MTTRISLRNRAITRVTRSKRGPLELVCCWFVIDYSRFRETQDRVDAPGIHF
ncbi:hypothetical protein [Pukyongiella litopenaei]|uniref:hypothetical protein n=1 Tax=Pukyongiella litopenaei TaxID=2605946 RepID=UPI001B8092E8|nr:hypothetical protein [Pukyongiella litopenaei]